MVVGSAGVACAATTAITTTAGLTTPGSGTSTSATALTAATTATAATPTRVVTSGSLGPVSRDEDPIDDSGRPTVRLLRGHTDALTVVPNGPTISLVAREDVTDPGYKTFHNPARIIFEVAPHTYTDATKNVAGVEAAGYVLHQVEDPTAIWLGFESTTVAELNPTEIRFVTEQVAGPGKVYLWGNGSFATSESLLGGGYELVPGATLTHRRPAHQHVNWLFTDPGTYTLTFHAEVDTAGRTLVSDPATYTFDVRDRATAPAGAGSSRGDGAAPDPAGSGGGTPTDPKAADPNNPGAAAGSNAPGALAGTQPAVGSQLGSLSHTGSDVIQLAAIAAALLTAGLGLLVALTRLRRAPGRATTSHATTGHVTTGHAITRHPATGAAHVAGARPGVDPAKNVDGLDNERTRA